jgi:hypothetical protein
MIREASILVCMIQQRRARVNHSKAWTRQQVLGEHIPVLGITGVASNKAPQ